jgi:hypothetical protein
MKTWPLVVAVLAVLGVQPVYAVAAAGPARVRVAGTVDHLAGGVLVVDEPGGGRQAVRLNPGVKIYGLEKRQFSDIKPGDFLASGGIRGADGKIHAVEVRIFPAALHGLGEGQHPWAVRQQGVMTNASVGTVSRTAAGGVIHVTFNGKHSEYIVGPEVPIVAYVPADRTLLKPGAAVVAIARKAPDGSLEAGRITAEKDGVKPRM